MAPSDDKADRDLNDELSFHLDMETRANLQRGLGPENAVREARRASGGVEQAKERHRDARPWRWAHDLAQDVRYALRSLRRAPAFTCVAVLTLALGIGANAAMFSVLNTYTLRPLPYPEPNRLMRVFRTSIHSQSWPHSIPNFIDHRQRNTVFDDLVLYSNLPQSLTTDRAPAEGLRTMQVTPDFFPALRVPPALGRWFHEAEAQPGANNVAILTDSLWRRRFAADEKIVGRTLQLDGQSVLVVGVMPPGFEHQLLWGSIDLWRPFAFTSQQRQQRYSNSFQEFGRLKAGVSREQAERSMVLLAANLSKETGVNKDESLRLEPLQRSQTDDVGRSAMWLAFANSSPVAGFNSSGPMIAEGQPEPAPGHYSEVLTEYVSLRYFQTLGIRLISGRLFDSHDTADTPPVIIVSEYTARRYWPNENAVGKRLSYPGTIKRWMQVVGVVSDVGFPGTLAVPYTRLESFQSIAQQPIGGMNITVRTTGNPESLAEPMRKITAALMPASPLNRIRTARALVDQNLGSTELFASLLGGFALLGLALATIGIYGVTSYSVAQRTGEIGIRMALGAQAADVLTLVLRKGTGLILLGAALGTFGAYGVAQLLLSMIPMLPARDPATPALLGLVLVSVGLLACYLPARRASKLDPAVALRHE